MFQSLNPKLDFFGLNISNNSVKFARIKKGKKGLNLHSYGRAALEPSTIQKGKVKNEDLLASDIKNLLRKKEVNTKYVATSLPEEKAFFQIIEIPKVKNSRLKKMIEYEAEDCIPLPVEDIYLDFEVISESKSSLQVLITALPKKIVDPHVSAIKKAGLFPVLAEVESMSIVGSLINDKDEGPLLLIDIGETKTILTILLENIIIFTSYILTSSDDFTKKIAEDNNISFDLAEEIKIDHGLTSKSRPDVAKSLKPLLEETTETIQKHLAYYNSCGFSVQNGRQAEEIKKIVLCGGGSNLKGLAEFLSDQLDLKVEKGDPFTKLSSQSRQKFDGDKLSYGAAIGLALRNFDNNNF